MNPPASPAYRPSDWSDALASGAVTVVDLTAPLSSSTPVLPLPEGMAPIPRFELEELARYDERGETSYQNGIHTGEHVGTHFDAPCHWVTGIEHGDVSQVPPHRLVGPAVVIDKTAEVANDPDYLLTVDDVQEWEGTHGTLPAGWLLYPEELRERAIRMAVDLRRDPETRSGALRRVGDQLGINPETLRNWVSQAEIDEGHRPGVTTEDAKRIAELEREVKELRRANEILKTSAAFFAAAELDRKLK